jgi:aryl-alcohol dehydrogenase-like predicted oxidoreductase
MITRELGCSGLQVSVLGLGGNTFGPPRIDSATTTQVIHAALAAGINFIDTAIMYGGGQSETFIGEALRGRRDQAVIATKFNFLDLVGDPRQRIREHCDESLRKLQTDRIDLLQVHTPSDEIATDGLLTALAELVEAGKVRAYGASNYSSWRLAESDHRARALAVAPFATVQSHYSLLYRRPEHELAQACERYGVSLIPFHPLAGGFLTGKYKANEPPPPGTRGAAGSYIVDKMSNERNWEIVSQLTEFAEQRGHSVAELAIAWLVAKPFVGSVITGLSNVGQLEQNVRGAEWVLTDDEVREVDEISDTGDTTSTENYVSQLRRPALSSTDPKS